MLIDGEVITLSVVCSRSAWSMGCLRNKVFPKKLSVCLSSYYYQIILPTGRTAMPGGLQDGFYELYLCRVFLLDRRQSNNDSMGEGRGVVIPGKGGGLRIVGLQTVGTGTIS